MFDKFSFLGSFWFRISLKCSRTFSSNNRSLGKILSRYSSQSRYSNATPLAFTISIQILFQWIEKKLKFWISILPDSSSKMGQESKNMSHVMSHDQKILENFDIISFKIRIVISIFSKIWRSDLIRRIWWSTRNSRSLTFDFNFWAQMGLRLEIWTIWLIVRQVWNQPWFICCLFCSQLFQFSL